jgi:tRNA pseudouridine55 synthase
VDGLIIIDKPAGLSSHDVINRARRILGTKRIGHTGTLDPFATGVLVLLVGQATRLAQFVNTDEKEYLAVARCGFATDTGDLTGSRLPANENELVVGDGGFSATELETAMAPLRGRIQQIPPMYSAKKVDGRKLYELARKGQEVERPPVGIEIRELEVASAFPTGAPIGSEHTWDFAFRVVCTAGTYVRTLAESIGANLGTRAHLVALRRTRAGNFTLENAATLEGLALAVDQGTLQTLVLPAASAVCDLPVLTLDSEGARRARHGLPCSGGSVDDSFDAGKRIALFDENSTLLGVGEYDPKAKTVQPRVMLATGV